MLCSLYFKYHYQISTRHIQVLKFLGIVLLDLSDESQAYLTKKPTIGLLIQKSEKVFKVPNKNYRKLIARL